MSDSLLPAIEIETTGNPTAAVIWLHGLGADGNDFAAIVPELGLPDTLGVRFIFPHAPMRPVTINNGYVMRAWYDIASPDFRTRSDEEGIRASQAAIEALIERERQRGIAPSRIVLAGFSQGGAIALQTGLRYPERLAGIMALSTYLPLAETLDNEASAANTQTPIFMAHGSSDTVVPFPLAVVSKQKLIRSGYPVNWQEYPMAHSVCLEEVQAMGVWLQQVFARA